MECRAPSGRGAEHDAERVVGTRQDRASIYILLATERPWRCLISLELCIKVVLHSIH